MENEAPNIAVVGCGQWGMNLVRVFSQLQALVAVVDLDQSRSAEALTRLAASGYTKAQRRQWDSVLSDESIHAVALATPASRHADMTAEALTAGKHVFVEKPLALAAADVDRLRHISREAGKVVMVGHLFRYHPAFVQLEELVAQGRLGRIRHIHSRRLGPGRIRNEEDAFWNLAPHDVSMILALVKGEHPETVRASGESYLQPGIADVVNAHLSFASGVGADVLSSWLYPERERKLVVVGERATVVFDDCAPTERKLVLHRHSPGRVIGVTRADGDGPSGASKAPPEEIIPFASSEPLELECRHFIECIQRGTAPLTDLVEGEAVVKVLCAVEAAVAAQHIANHANQLEPTPPPETTALGSIDSAKGDSRHLDPVPLVDLGSQKRRIQESLDRRLGKALNELDFVMGREVGELETKLCEYTGASHAITCASGTDALTLALMALNLGPGDAVLVPAMTFVATVEPVALLGATPIILDVLRDTLSIDPCQVREGIAAARQSGLRPVGLIAVDLYGHPADYTKLREATADSGLWVIADAAQSFGGSDRGRRVGTMADMTTTSFFPSKPLGCYGDGGAVLTDNAEMASVLRSLRLHGRGHTKFASTRVGLNSRLDTIQAAVLLCKLDVLEEEMRSRREAAARYEALFGAIEGFHPVRHREGVNSAWASYVVRTDDRDRAQTLLSERNIASNAYYPVPIHWQEAYKNCPIAGGTCPVAEEACSQVIAIPMHPYLVEEVQTRIVGCLR